MTITTRAPQRRPRTRRHALVRERLVELGIIWTLVGFGYTLYSSNVHVWNPGLIALGFYAAGLATLAMAVHPTRFWLAWGAALTNVALTGRTIAVIIGAIAYGTDSVPIVMTQVGLTLAGGFGLWRWWRRDVREWSEGGTAPPGPS